MGGGAAYTTKSMVRPPPFALPAFIYICTFVRTWTRVPVICFGVNTPGGNFHHSPRKEKHRTPVEAPTNMLTSRAPAPGLVRVLIAAISFDQQNETPVLLGAAG
jgi:hypothetical protein